MENILLIIKKEFFETSRDPRMLFLMLVTPLIQLILFGYVASTDVRHISTAVLDEDRTSISRRFMESFKNSSYFDLNYYIGKETQAKELIDSGKVDLVIRIGNEFSKKIEKGESAAVLAIIDASNSNTANIVSSYISGIIWTKTGELVKKALIKVDRNLSIEPLEARTRFWYNPELKSVNFMVPGLLALVLMMQVMLLSALAIVKEKEYGTMEQLIVSPVRRYEIMVGKMVPFVIIGFVQITLVLLIAIYWFGVPFKGNIFLLYALDVVFLLPAMGLGILISTISKTQHQAMMSAFFILYPSILLAGFMFPIINMPLAIQYLTDIIPLKYFLIIVRGIYQKGIGINYLLDQVWPLLILGVAIFILSLLGFRKQLE
ncbi:MAG: ABC transporter permease [Candidatus Saganbacteria bacterium]|nr:ABC transporter permease [Candidatus Saganbacteria bacterium]